MPGIAHVTGKKLVHTVKMPGAFSAFISLKRWAKFDASSLIGSKLI